MKCNYFPSLGLNIFYSTEKVKIQYSSNVWMNLLFSELGKAEGNKVLKGLLLVSTYTSGAYKQFLLILPSCL